MNITESTLYTKAIYSEDNQHRYLLKKIWDESKKKAAVIMLYPCAADINELDTTTMLVLNALNKLEYGSVELLNLYSRLNADTSHDISTINTFDNDKQILESVQAVDNLIIAYGTVGENSKKVAARQTALLKILSPYKDKVVTTKDEKGKLGMHPLAPTLRTMRKWEIVPFEFPIIPDEPEEKEKPENESKKKGNRRGKKQAETTVELTANEDATTETTVETTTAEENTETA